MIWLARLRRRVRALLRKEEVERELDEELRFHVEMETQDLIRTRGLAPEEARRQALIAFGGVERYKEEAREARGVRLVEAVARDLRQALRRLRREPGFSAPVVATLALGIGSAVAILTLVNAVLLRPLPYAEPDRLVAVRHAAPGFGIRDGGQSGGTYLHYREHNRVFEEIGAYYDLFQALTDGDEAERIRVAMSTPSVLSLLGVKPHVGRLFTEDDARQERLVVMISHDLWVRRYGADSAIIGRTIEINRGSREVVGVLPPGFDFPHPDTHLWWGMPVETSTAGVRDLYMSAVARLRDGVSVRAAEADLQRLVPSLAEAYPDATAELLAAGQFRAVVIPIKDAVIGEVRPVLVFLLAAVGFLLLVVLANAVNLFLIRAERQRRQVALERMLGARGSDLARRFFGESLMLGAVGGALGAGLAWLAVRARFGFAPGQIPRLHELQSDGSIVAFAGALAMLCALLLGCVSFARARRRGFAAALAGGFGAATAPRERQHAQRLLSALQVAIALTLLVGSAVMARSFWQLRQAELGFDPENVLAFELPLPVLAYRSYYEATRFQQQVLEEVRALPGVAAAETTVMPPLTSMPDFYRVPVARADLPTGVHEVARTTWVGFATPGYHAAMGIPLLRGRGFEARDIGTETPAVILSDALARTLFGGEDPIGRGVLLTDFPRHPAYTVVGVAGDVPGENIAAGPVSTLYFPTIHDPSGSPEVNPPIPFVPREGTTVIVRTTIEPVSLLPSVRRIVQALDPKVPVARVRTMEQEVDASMARTRLTMLLLLIAAGTALGLGVVGIYGVISYTVSQRRAEFGVRLALGATPSNVSRMVLRQGARIALTGIAAGLLAASWSTRLLGGLTYDVNPKDPATFGAVALLLFLIALLASWLPARRAARLDPTTALRSD